MKPEISYAIKQVVDQADMQEKGIKQEDIKEFYEKLSARFKLIAETTEEYGWTH